MIDFDRFALDLRSACDRHDLVEVMTRAASSVDLQIAYGVTSIFDTRLVDCLFSDGGSVEGAVGIGRGLMDLVIGRAVTERLPFFWWVSADALVETCPVAGWDPAAGWAVPVHDGLGCVAVMTFGALRQGDAIEVVVERHKAALHVMAIHFHARVRDLPAAAPFATSPRLTPRELQCLEGIA